MKTIKHVTFIATYAPRRCGIATFTQDLRGAVEGARSGVAARVAAIARCQSESHPVEVERVVAEQVQGDYRALREALNASNTDLVSLQHEYGIFGGPDGAWILDTLRGLKKPVVTTCHTVLDSPTAGQQEVLREIGRVSAHMVVMTWKAREILMSKYDVHPESITVIPHGIPDTEPAGLPRDELRRTFGFMGRQVLLTTGLLSPGKGLEHAIAAMPRILTACPGAVYVIAGATHPNLLQSEGETYRGRLQHLAAELGIAESVLFLDRFFSREELVNLITAADVFVTPYLGEAQITSGVLAYASGLGKPVISTPYWHARELLGDGLGVLVPFASPDDLAGAAIDLLGDAARLKRMSDSALERGRFTRWMQIGRDYLDLFDANACREIPAMPQVRGARPRIEPSLDHLFALMGPLGIYQHARLAIPDPGYGYCTDDNARAAILALDWQQAGHPCGGELEGVRQRCSAFVQEAFDESLGRFRNFRADDGRWLESQGSEDSHGRALWALGHLAWRSHDVTAKDDAAALFQRGLPAVWEFSSPRAWAFALLGLAAFRRHEKWGAGESKLQLALAQKLAVLYRRCADRDWRWFETVVSYDNARLPQALLLAAWQTGDMALQNIALAPLAWLVDRQKSIAGHFRAIGCHGFYHRGDPLPPQWDQQPLEAHACVGALCTAYRITGNEEWARSAHCAFAWFEGANDLALPVIDPATGACFDGLQEHGLNLNRGAESTLAWLQSCCDMHELQSHKRSGMLELTRTTHRDARMPVA